MTTQLIPYGDRAWLIDGADDPVTLADGLHPLLPAGAEVVVGARTCLLRFPDTAPRRDDLSVLVAQAGAAAGRSAQSGPAITIRVRYDGEDLQSVADQAGISAADVVALHSGATYRVAFLGFAPGFAYLTGLPSPLLLPRRSAPRVRVPAGAVAIADRYSAVYPRSSPGGWHLLGSSTDWLFDVRRDPPARLSAGAVVRFKQA